MDIVYPIMLDVRQRVIVVVGGGAVAVRKVKGLLQASAQKITVIAPRFRDDMPDVVVKVTEPYAPHLLAGAQLVFAATDDSSVNDAVVGDCRERGILCNRADTVEALAGDFVTAATLRNGPIAATVSAGSPALSAMIRDGLAARWDIRWTRMAEAMAILRPRIMASPDLAPARRTEIFRSLATEEALEAIAGGDIGRLIEWLAKSSVQL